MMPYLSCKKIENDVYNFPTWQYCKYKDIFDSRIIINSTAKFYISISYQKDLLSIDTRIFTPSTNLKNKLPTSSEIHPTGGVYFIRYSTSPITLWKCSFILVKLSSLRSCSNLHASSFATSGLTPRCSSILLSTVCRS